MNGGRPAANGPTATASPLDTRSVAQDTDFLAGLAVGIDAGLAVGWRQGWDAHVDQVQQRFGLAVLDAPTQDRLAQLRAVDHQPCQRRCRACSRCTHSLAYYGRGGRDYFGVEAERELAQAAAERELAPPVNA
jgi:hypothetical protein